MPDRLLGRERQEFEDLWRRRLQAAKLRLGFATSHLNEVQRHFAIDDTSPDGQLAYERALHAQNGALAQYNRILRTVSDLVLDGRIPEEEEWRKADGES